MKNLGIVISTYQRPDGKTPELLTRTLNAINNQTYTNWKVYLIGDNYNNQKYLMCFHLKFFDVNRLLKTQYRNYTNCVL